jgi:hypothetical protein
MEVPVGEDEFRYRYREDRVLLDYRGFLPDEGVGQAVYLTQSELQMLRNMCGYLDRRSTWVFQYHDGFYNAPSNDDWDMISALVAELEGKLMPSQVTPWGYTDRWLEDLGGVQSGDGNYVGLSTQVPPGYVYVVQGLFGRNDSRSPMRITLYVSGSGINHPVFNKETPAQYEAVLWDGEMVLKAGESALVYVVGCLNGDLIVASVRGYKMVIG